MRSVRDTMTNVEIRRHAAKLAALHAARAVHMTPEDAWYLWSAEQGITSPAARMLFERFYEARLATGSRSFSHH